MNGTLFFSANDGVNGKELWKSDGTAAGTTLVKEINIGNNSSFLEYLTRVNGPLFFPLMMERMERSYGNRMEQETARH